MELLNKNPGIKLTATRRNSKLKNVSSLLDVNMKVKEFNQDLVLNIRFDGLQVVDLIKYFLEKSFNERFGFVGPDNENSIKELSVNGKDKVPVLSIDNKSALTGREIEIMEKLSLGRINKEIADDLGLCVNTVRAHLQNIYNKLRVGNRAEAIVKYLNIHEKNKKD